MRFLRSKEWKGTFEIWSIPEDQWLYVAKVAMEDKALTWFHWWQGNATSQSWPFFKNAIVKRFHQELVQNPFELLLGMR